MSKLPFIWPMPGVESSSSPVSALHDPWLRQRAIPGLTNAMHTEGPVISIAGCADTHDLGRGAQQEIDRVAMAAPICKGSFMVNDARRIPEFIARALRLADGAGACT